MSSFLTFFGNILNGKQEVSQENKKRIDDVKKLLEISYNLDDIKKKNTGQVTFGKIPRPKV